jgi:WD40 repeat protein
MIEHCSPLSRGSRSSGDLIATAGYDNQVILWNGLKNIPISRAFHDHLANHCAFSPDGKFLVTSSSDYSARVWLVPELRLYSVLHGHNDDVEMATFSPDSSRIATASRDHCIRIFTCNGTLIAHTKGHDADALSVVWTIDGKTVISTGDDGTVRSWCSATGRLLETITLNGIETDTAVVDSKGAIYCGNDCGELLYMSSGLVWRKSVHDAGVKRLALDENRGILISTSYDRYLKVWKIEGQGNIQLINSTRMPPQVWGRSIALTPSGKIVVGTFGSRYATYCFEKERWCLDQVRETNGLNAVAVIDGNTYSTGDGGIVYRNGVSQARIGSLCNFLLPYSGGLVTGGHLGIVFDGFTGEPIYQHHSPLNCGVVIQKDRLLLGSYTGEGLVFKIGTDGKLKHLTSIPMHRQAVKGLAVSDERVFSISASGDAALWRSRNLTLISHIEHAHDKIANGVAALPGGRFATVSRDLSLRIWDDFKHEIYISPHTYSIKCICTSRDGRWIATGSYGGYVAIYDTHKHVWSDMFRPTMAGISCLAHSNEADEFIASSYDSYLYVINPLGERKAAAMSIDLQ